VVLGCVLGPLTCSGIHDDELRCELAVAQLASCCPGFDTASIDCRNRNACSNSTTRPQLSLEQSACILDRSCEELTRSAGAAAATCTRALTPTLLPDRPALCP
jgi:hypothetical protein